MRGKHLHKVFQYALRTPSRMIVACYVVVPRNATMDCHPRYIGLAFVPTYKVIAGLLAALGAWGRHTRPMPLPSFSLPVRNGNHSAVRSSREVPPPALRGDVAANVSPLTLAISAVSFKAANTQYGRRSPRTHSVQRLDRQHAADRPCFGLDAAQATLKFRK